MEEKKEHKKSKTRLYILLLILISIVVFSIIVPCRVHECLDARKIVCRMQLNQLAIASSLYREYNSRFDTPDKWSDNIKKDLQEGPNCFQCPADPNGPCSYAMNENIPADAKDLPGDLVLLFESTPGWNQVGGVDDVVTDRHSKPGANIAFADGHVEFVKPEDIPNLRWEVEQKPEGRK